MFVSARRDVCAAKSAVAVYRNQIGVGANLRLNIGINLADIAAVAHVLTRGADGNYLIRGIDGAAAEYAQADIAVAGGVVSQRISSDSRVGEACGVVNKRSITNGRVDATSCVVKKGAIAVGRVKAAKFPARSVGVVGRSGIANRARTRQWPCSGCR